MTQQAFRLPAVALAAALAAVPIAGAHASLSSYAVVDPGWPLQHAAASGQQKFDGTVSQQSTTAGTQGSGPYFTGSAWSLSAYGVLKNRVSATLQDFPYQSYTSTCGNSICGPAGNPAQGQRTPAWAYSEFIDQITISGGTGTGYARINLSIDGTSSLTSSGSLVAPYASEQLSIDQVDPGNVHTHRGQWSVPGDGAQHSYQSALIPFTYGTPFGVGVLSSSTISPTDWNAGSGTYDLSGSVDFSNTTTVQQIDVFSDANGANPVTGFGVRSASGTVYGAASPLPANVPEPAAWLLLATGLGLLAPLRRRG